METEVKIIIKEKSEKNEFVQTIEISENNNLLYKKETTDRICKNNNTNQLIEELYNIVSKISWQSQIQIVNADLSKKPNA